MNRWICFLLIFAAFLLQKAIAQPFPPTGSTASGTSGNPLSNPWTGGMNAMQFCEIDLNLDGLSDLLVFDRHGNRILPMIRSSVIGVSFDYQPETALMLPPVTDWIKTADFNCDGKMDIFCYQNGGIKVFENISTTTLAFKLKTEMVESWYYNGYIGILVTSVDYPAIADIDGDGDLDILTFFGLGSYVEFHKNLSMEKFGHCDSLDFRLEDPCWGHFRESESGNKITLHVTCPIDAPYDNRPGKDRHTGSTLVTTDLNGDGLQDLILGDYDYPNLIALYNGGTSDSADIISQDTTFPQSHAVNLFSFPSVSMVDADGDGKKDMLVSSFDPALETSENYRCAWLYKNTGTNQNPVFEFQSDSFLRDGMLDFGSGAHPVLYDLDSDGLTDLLAGNDGYYDTSWYQGGFLKSRFISRIAWFRNRGTATQPVFKCLNDDLAALSALGLRGLFPAPGDYDQDGITDLVTGCSDGTLIFLKGIKTAGDTLQFASPVRNWLAIDVGEYSTPQCFDLDKDQLPDLVIGEKNGNINWYRNTGNAGNPLFTLITDSLGKINVTNPALSYFGFSTPCFFRERSGNTLLTVGSSDGAIHFFGQIDQNLTGSFQRSDSLYRWLASNPADTLFGWQTSPATGSVTDPEGTDLIVGNYSGGLRFITKRISPDVIAGLVEPDRKGREKLSVFPNPADNRVTIVTPGEHGRTSNLEIFNYIGNLLVETKFSKNISLDVSGFTPGIYIVRCGNQVTKLQIIHP